MISRAVVLRVIVGVGLVLELAGQEPAVRLGELDGLHHHAEAALRLRGQHHLGAEEAHQPAPLDAELLRHGHHQRIALGGAYHGEADAGVAAGRLDHGLAGLQLARFLRRLDDAERQAVLDRAERVEGLDLDVEVDALGRQLVDPHDRRVADGLQDALVLACHVLPPSWATARTASQKSGERDHTRTDNAADDAPRS